MLEEEEQAKLVAQIEREPETAKGDDDIPSIKSYHSSQEREKEKPCKQKVAAQNTAEKERLRAQEELREYIAKKKSDRPQPLDEGEGAEYWSNLDKTLDIVGEVRGDDG